MRRITGTHVYSYAKCPRLAALDLSLDRSERRAPHAWEEFSMQRGRDFEDRYVEQLGVVQPKYAPRDWEEGARATMELMRNGAPWIHQGVLLADDRLGIPDLMRKVEGASAFGAHHYEVIDVKSSGRARGDQVLQVLFYTRLLAEAQQRMPARGGIVLKTGAEHTFVVADYLAVASDVEQRVLELARSPDGARPFWQRGCESCHWNERCRIELERSDDLSLVTGMSHGARAILEANHCKTARDLAELHTDSRLSAQIDPALLRRLRKSAQARVQRSHVLEARPRLPKNAPSLDKAALVHLLTDPYADRVVLFSVRHPIASEDGAVVRTALPRSRDEEWSCLRSLLAELPIDAPLLHFDSALPRWYEAHAWDREAEVGLSSRFFDMQRRLRAWALMPEPVYSLGDFVRVVLARDPLRAGHASQAAMWAEAGDDDALVQKARSDLDDLAELKRRILDAAPLTFATL